MRKWVLAGVAAAFAVVAAAGARAPKVGEVAPDFRLKTFDGQEVTLASLRGDVVILNMWATWCAPCRAELPLLDTYYKLRKDVGLRVYAVATEGSIPDYTLRKTLGPMLVMPMARIERGPYFVMDGLPTNYVFDRSGKLVYAKSAAFDLDALNALLVPLLREPAPADAPAPPAPSAA